MREIKLKAFYNGKMNEVLAIDFDNNQITLRPPDYHANPIIVMLDDVELIQYTGRKDKNDKEIYDGDIFDGGLLVRFGEGWFEGHYGYTGIILCDNADELSVDNELKTDKEHLANYEIIGNVWENPELLKELQ